MNISDVLAPEYVAPVRNMIAHKSDSKTPTVYELEIITKDGRRVRLEVSTRFIYEDGAPVGVQVVDEFLGAAEQLRCLGQVDDVDPVALAEDELLHLGVPALRLVAEVDAGLE